MYTVDHYADPLSTLGEGVDRRARPHLWCAAPLVSRAQARPSRIANFEARRLKFETLKRRIRNTSAASLQLTFSFLFFSIIDAAHRMQRRLRRLRE